jgi:hypothetical protein
MPTDCNPKLFAFEAVERKSVVAAFDGSAITSNAGALLLGRLDHGLGVVRRFAECFTDRRDPRFVEHRLETLIGQRVFGLALGYEDLNDHDELRRDPVFALLAGKLKARREDCEPVAGKSTLNRLERMPKRHGAKYHKRSSSISTPPISPCSPIRKDATPTAITTTTSTCRCKYSVAAICFWFASAAPMSTRPPARSKRSSAW